MLNLHLKEVAPSQVVRFVSGSKFSKCVEICAKGDAFLLLRWFYTDKRVHYQLLNEYLNKYYIILPDMYIEERDLLGLFL